MAEIAHRTVRTNGIDMHIAEAGAGKPVILCHGFPELWYSYRHQIPALADAGYHAIAPDQRGYGKTGRPPRVEDYGIRELTGDLLGLLDDLGVEKGVFVGHDWGALIVWDLAQLHPDRVEGVVGMSVPFIKWPVKPTELFESLSGGNFFYILYFQEVGPADEELVRDPRRTMSRILWSASGDAPRDAVNQAVPRAGTGFLDVMSDMPALPGWLSQEDLDYFVAEFERTGFTGGINYYRNLDRNWQITKDLEPSRISMPSAFIGGERDGVISGNLAALDTMKQVLPEFRGSTLIPEAGHWNQQERPKETTQALLDFLAGLS